MVQEAVSRVAPPGEDWRCVGSKGNGDYVWHRRCTIGLVYEEVPDPPNNYE